MGGRPAGAADRGGQTLPTGRHVVFYAMDDKGLTEGEGRYGYFYGTIPIQLAGTRRPSWPWT